MCCLAGVSRAGYYRQLEESQPDEAEMALRTAIQEIVLAHHRRYGQPSRNRRVASPRHGGQPQARATRDADRQPTGSAVPQIRLDYGFSARSPGICESGGEMTLTGIDQLWVADITYIRLRTEFVFLAVVIDRFSRKAIGWALDRSMAARLAIAALRHAIAHRQPPPGVVHHSDQGTQYASAEYIAVLTASQMMPSMSRPGNPYDNAFCESFMKTLKQEEIYCNQYADFEELSQHLEEFIGAYYNRLRLHSALGYRTPEEFERDAAAAPSPGASQDAA